MKFLKILYLYLYGNMYGNMLIKMFQTLYEISKTLKKKKKIGCRNQFPSPALRDDVSRNPPLSHDLPLSSLLMFFPVRVSSRFPGTNLPPLSRAQFCLGVPQPFPSFPPTVFLRSKMGALCRMCTEPIRPVLGSKSPRSTC